MPDPAAAPRRRAASKPRSPRVGLALAGGGPLGAIYEIGALCALDESVIGLDLNDLAGYVGVSAGGLIATGLANGITPRQLCSAFIENRGPRADRIRPSLFFRPALPEFAQRAAMLPGLVAQAALQYAFERRSLLAALERLGRALPTGLFSHAALEAQLLRMFTAPGRSNDFRRLRHKLVLVATDLDTGAAAPFGQPGWDHVPISQAVAASAALPGLFPPVPIDGRWYVDGALKKTLHARVLLDMDLDLVLCLNPLVPFASTASTASTASAASKAGRHRLSGGTTARIPQLVQGGLPVVLAQTFRSLIHSRLELGMQGYAHTHPDTDILLFEPDQHDPEMFLANTFGYARRRQLAEHAYQQTRADLRSRRSHLVRTLDAHGLQLDHAALDDPRRRLLTSRRRARSTSAQTLQRLDEVLRDLEGALQIRPRAVQSPR
jgi:NTE family protein